MPTYFKAVNEIRMMSKNLFIVHYRPIENYPPVQNLIRYADSTGKFSKISCYSTRGKHQLIHFDKNIEVNRWASSSGRKLSLWWGYLIFSILTLLSLISNKALNIVCYESISVLPVYLYVRFFNRKSKVYLHYHEYRTIEESKGGSTLEYYLMGPEKYLLRKCCWLSHTNETRLSKYLSDHNLIFDPSIHHQLPNYPSKEWAIQNIKWEDQQTVKFVYVGYTLTKDGSYLKELANYLLKQELKVELDIYCLEENEFMRSIVQDFPELNVRLKKAVNYEALAEVISQYHIGLILYKAKTQNYIHNAPNKLFEYLSCGLDVWYPQEMEGIHAFDCKDQPKVLRLDFNHLEKYSFESLLATTEVKIDHRYSAEDVYEELISKMVKIS